MDKTLDTWLDLYECAVIGDDYNLTLDGVTNLEVRIECIPWMWSKLLQTESDSLLLLVKVKDDNVDLLIQLDNFLWIADAAP